ncbi:MAG TPA: NEW3 domain-containing protein [Gemmatimonadaceae bacterium]|nr:NEW3 domain-containing protein [Gemmatimonadaceae bacterium]
MRPRRGGRSGPGPTAWIVAALLIGAFGSSRAQTVSAGADSTRLAVVVDTTPREFDPGASATLRVIVQELASQNWDVVLGTSVPAGWRVLTEPLHAQLAPHERVIRLVQISIPHDAPAGEYHVEHALRAAGLEQDIQARSTLIVRARRSISVTLLDQPYFAASGSTFRTTFLVSNLGNVRTRVHLHARSEQDRSVTIDTLTALAPGETRQVNVLVEAGGTSGSADARHLVTLVADVDGGLTTDAKAIPQAAASVRVVPANEGAGLPWHTLPIALRMNSTGTAESGKFVGGRSESFQLAGAGPLTEGGSTTIDVFARGPRPDTSFFGERDEYRVGLTGTNYGLRLGDQMFRLTPLTDAGSFATGVSGHYTRGRWSTGGELSHDRSRPDGASQEAAFVGFDPRATVHLSANLLERTEPVDGSGATGGMIGTVYASAKPTPKSIVELERGVGLLGAGAGASATLFRAAGDNGRVAFDVRHRSSDSAYQSGTGGFGENLATVTVRPAAWLRVSSRLDEQTQSTEQYLASLDQPLGSPQVFRSAAFTADVVGLFSTGVRASSESGSDTDLPGLNASGLETSGWARVAGAWGVMSGAVTAERGSFSNDGLTHAFSDTRIQASARATTQSSFGMFIERSTGLRRYMATPQDMVTAGVTAQLQYRALTLVMTGTAAPSKRFSALPDTAWMIPGATAFADAALAYAFIDGRSVSIRARTMSAGPNRPVITTVRVEYAMPVQVPIGRSSSQGRVVGRVYNAQTGAGIANALVRIGDRAALTDNQGRVAFGGIAPNRYPVLVDLGAGGGDGAGLADGAIEVAALAGHTTEVGVRVTQLGRITGTITLFDRVDSLLQTRDSMLLQKTRGLAGIVIALTNGSEERHVLSASDGSFELDNARPGLWRVAVSNAGLPTQHVVQGDTVRVVDLAVGATATVQISVVPRQRKILPLDTIIPKPPTIKPPAEEYVPEERVPEERVPQERVPQERVPEERMPYDAPASDPPAGSPPANDLRRGGDLPPNAELRERR